MLVISGTMVIDPTKSAQFEEAAGELVAATLAEEGCMSYGFYADPARPGSYRMFEEWETQEALGAHMASAHMAEFMVGLGDVGVASTELFLYAGAEKTRLM